MKTKPEEFHPDAEVKTQPEPGSYLEAEDEEVRDRYAAREPETQHGTRFRFKGRLVLQQSRRQAIRGY